MQAQLAGKLVVDCVNPLGFDKQGRLRAGGRQRARRRSRRRRCCRSSRVVGAFHHVSAVLLLDLVVDTFDTDVLVVGDDRRPPTWCRHSPGSAPGMRGVYAGRLRNAHQVEALTANLISVNRRYKAHAGVRVTDV